MPEIFFEHNENSSLTYSGGELKIREASKESGFGIRVIEDKRIGFSYCQNESDIEQAIKDAKKIALLSQQTNFSFAPKSKYTIPDIYDPSLDPDNVELLRDLLIESKDAIESTGGKARVTIGAEKTSYRLENEEGFEGEYSATDFSLYSECMNGDGLGINYVTSNFLPKTVADSGYKAAEMAKEMQKAKKPENGIYTVVMEIQALDNIFETLIPSFSGDWKRRGITTLKENYFFNEKFNMMEDGHAIGTEGHPFDDEGVPSQKRILVEDGVIKSFLYNREVAALEGIDAGGTCIRSSFDDRPGIGSSNIVVQPGDCKDLSELGKHIELHFAHGSHTANLTTGDIGLEVTTAFLVKNGKRTPLKGFMIVSNIFEMFKNIEAIEKQQKVYGWLITPRIAFSNQRIVA